MSEIDEGTEDLEVEEEPELSGEITPEEEPAGEEPPEKPELHPWLKQVKPELQQNPDIAKHDKPEALCTDYLEILAKNKELEGKISEKPTRPEKPEDYDFKLPAGYQVDENLVNRFKQWSHEADLSQEQAESIFNKYNDELISMNEQGRRMVEEAREKTDKYCHDKWGGDYDLNKEQIRRGMIQFGGPHFERFMDVSGLGNHPQMIDFMLNVSKSIGEGVFIEGEKEPGQRPYQAPEEEEVLFPSMEEKEINKDSKFFITMNKIMLKDL